MADEAFVKFIYPPNFAGTYDEAHLKGTRRVVVKCTNYSDGTGEDEVAKIKREDMRTETGETPSFLVVERIVYDVSGMVVRVCYNNNTDDPIAILNQANSPGELDFRDIGGFMPMLDDSDETIVGGGDIIFTTEGASSGDTYDITLFVRLKQ